MTQVPTRIKTEAPHSPFESSLERELLSYSRKVADILNRGIRFEENLENGFITIADTGGADSEITVSHTLKRIPVGFLVINKDKYCDVRTSGTAWTTTDIYIKCSVANCNIKLFLL